MVRTTGVRAAALAMMTTMTSVARAVPGAAVVAEAGGLYCTQVSADIAKRSCTMLLRERRPERVIEEIEVPEWYGFVAVFPTHNMYCHQGPPVVQRQLAQRSERPPPPLQHQRHQRRDAQA